MVNWKNLLSRIPSKIQLSRKSSYEVVYTKEFHGSDHLGETRSWNNQIVIKLDDTPKETVHTYLHELLHAVSYAYNVNLTEAQVTALEKAVYYMLKPGNVFKE